MKITKLALLLFLISPLLVNGQTKSINNSPNLSVASPSSVGMSSERLERIDDMIEDAISGDIIPGAVAIVVRNGKIVYQKNFGHSDVESKKEFARDDIFRIASQTKAITTTAVMMLWEEGHFFLDDPISKFIPEFKNPQLLDQFSMADSSYTTKDAGSEITIRQLINHTSGIGYGFIDPDDKFKAIYVKAGITEAFTTSPLTLEENIKKLAKLPIHHVPGEAFIYSMGIDVLGYLVEVVSGQKFDVYLSEHLFQPLGMVDTYFYLPESKSDRLVNLNTKNEDGWLEVPIELFDANFAISGAKTFFSGGGGLSCTINDYASFLQMYLNGGELNGTRYLSRKTVEAMLSNHSGNLFSGPNGNKGFGLGYAILNRTGQMKGGLGSAGTFDWGGIFNTSYFADPKENIIGIIMKQTMNVAGDDTSAKFRQLVFQAIDD